MAKKKHEEKRPFISVYFECCRVYNRVYINRDRTAYLGWCPKCCRRVEVKISPFGTDNRFFKAT
jgi:hypothetical protein